MNLLDKSRALNHWLQEAPGQRVEFTEMAEVLCRLINANIYITGRNGRILGHALTEGSSCDVLAWHYAEYMAIPEVRNGMFLNETRTVTNRLTERRSCVLGITEKACPFGGLNMAIVPIIIRGERQGSLILTKGSSFVFDDEDTILAEYGAIVIGMEILRARLDEAEEGARQKAAVQAALATLSFSEEEALLHIFNEINGTEALVVASRIADQAGITRSVIVTAMRKLESAGIVGTKSLGMKGTHIRILNDNLVEELDKRRK